VALVTPSVTGGEILFDPYFDAKKAAGEFMFTLLEGLAAKPIQGDPELWGEK